MAIGRFWFGYCGLECIFKVRSRGVSEAELEFLYPFMQIKTWITSSFYRFIPIWLIHDEKAHFLFEIKEKPAAMELIRQSSLYDLCPRRAKRQRHCTPFETAARQIFTHLDSQPTKVSKSQS